VRLCSQKAHVRFDSWRAAPGTRALLDTSLEIILFEASAEILRSARRTSRETVFCLVSNIVQNCKALARKMVLL
jgi:hypothetical protein